MNRQASICWLAILSILGSTAAGCGPSGPQLVPVSGRVLIDGKPLSTGYVRLFPASTRAAGGRLAPDGRFTLTTFETGDGVALGTHRVQVVASEMISESAVRWHAPKKYADYATSQLTATIDGPADNLTIELSWNGGKPFIERD